jgi:hypothetical protein
MSARGIRARWAVFVVSVILDAENRFRLDSQKRVGPLHRVQGALGIDVFVDFEGGTPVLRRRRPGEGKLAPAIQIAVG